MGVTPQGVVTHHVVTVGWGGGAGRQGGAGIGGEVLGAGWGWGRAGWVGMGWVGRRVP